jgi:membrane protein
VPLFLFWLYASWLILLLGAQLSFYVQHPEYLRTGHADIPTTGVLRERLALSVMVLLAERFVRGTERWSTNGLAERLDVPGTVLGGVVSALEAHGLVLTTEDDSLIPARDLGSIKLAGILDAIRHEMPDPRRPEPRPVAAADAVAQSADEALRASLGDRTLLDLVRSSP